MESARGFVWCGVRHLQGDLSKPQRRQRRLIVHLGDNGTSRRKGRADLPSQEEQRKVPGCDGADDPHRLVEGVTVESIVDRDHLREEEGTPIR